MTRDRLLSAEWGAFQFARCSRFSVKRNPLATQTHLKRYNLKKDALEPPSLKYQEYGQIWGRTRREERLKDKYFLSLIVNVAENHQQGSHIREAPW